MSTQLFMLDANEAGVTVGTNTQFQLGTARGSANATKTTDLTTGGNHIVATTASGGATMIWLYRVNAVTISSTITFNFWCKEFAMTDNAGMGVIVSRYDSAGTFVADVVAQANANHANGVELGTVVAAMNWTATPTSTAFSAGDWLAVIIHADAVGTMAQSSNSFSLQYNGSTAASAGDSYVTFTEAITQYSAAATQVPFTNPYVQLLPQ